MAVSPRRTAILKLGELGNPSELRALDVQRVYPFELTIDGRVVGGGGYTSPLGDQVWRDVMAAMGRAVEAEDKELAALRRPLETVRNAGRQLYLSIAQLAPELRAFLVDTAPRRLVIMSGRAELHALPWEAMVDEQWSHPQPPACRLCTPPTRSTLWPLRRQFLSRFAKCWALAPSAGPSLPSTIC